jgi:LysM repeat protein
LFAGILMHQKEKAMTNKNGSEYRIFFYLLPLLYLLVSIACNLPGITPRTSEPANIPEVGTNTSVPTINISEATPIIVIPVSAQLKVRGDIANLRIGPGIEYPEIGQVSAGDVITINGMVTDGTWYRLEAQQETWISSEFVSSVPVDLPAQTATAQNVTNPSPEPVNTIAPPAPANTVAPPAPVNTVASPQTLCLAPPANWVIYTVQPGDTLFSLSSQTGTNVDEVMRANCMENSALTVGQSLYLPRLPKTAILPDTPSPMPTASPTAVAINTPIHTTTPLPTDTPVIIDTPTSTSTSTPTSIPINTPTDTPPPVVTGAPVQTTVLPLSP